MFKLLCVPRRTCLSSSSLPKIHRFAKLSEVLTQFLWIFDVFTVRRITCKALMLSARDTGKQLIRLKHSYKSAKIILITLGLLVLRLCCPLSQCVIKQTSKLMAKLSTHSTTSLDVLRCVVSPAVTHDFCCDREVYNHGVCLCHLYKYAQHILDLHYKIASYSSPLNSLFSSSFTRSFGMLLPGVPDRFDTRSHTSSCRILGGWNPFISANKSIIWCLILS